MYTLYSWCVYDVYFELNEFLFLKGIDMYELFRLPARNVLILGMFFAVCMAGCQEGRSSAWLYGENDFAAARFGAFVTENEEVGAVIAYMPHAQGNTELYGIYGLHHFPGALSVPSPFPTVEPNDMLLEATTYLGAQAMFDHDYHQEVSIVMGMVFEDVIFLEHQYDAFNNDLSKTMLGLRIKF